MKIAITGSTGLVGSATVDHFIKNGHDVTRIVRSESSIQRDENAIHWDVQKKEINSSHLEGFDAIIHLAGAGIAAKRWTPRYKALIRSSRIDGTALLSKTIAQLQEPPKVFLSASAVGFYGLHCADVTLTESHPSGSDFLAQVCVEWEQATRPVEEKGIRVVHMRLGAVLSKKGGALGKMLPIFKLGGGGKIGNGEQMFSWVALDEIPVMMEHAINSHTISGPVNFVSPHPVSNAEFTRTLGSIIDRPTVLPLPGFAVVILFGEMGKALLLGGSKVLPEKLVDDGYAFKYPQLKEALHACLK